MKPRPLWPRTWFDVWAFCLLVAAVCAFLVWFEIWSSAWLERSLQH